MGVHAHHKAAVKHAKCMVITVSDSRSLETDTSGLTMAELLTEAGHSVVERVIVTDDTKPIQDAVGRGLADDGVDAILINGGTGVAPRDITIEAITPLLRKQIPGYGELFRMLSYEEIGAAAMLSRAIAGHTDGTVIFATPGSTGAVRLAMSKLILPELGHLIFESRKGLVKGNEKA